MISSTALAMCIFHLKSKKKKKWLNIGFQLRVAYNFDAFIIAATFLKFLMHVINVILLRFCSCHFFSLTHRKRVILKEINFLCVFNMFIFLSILKIDESGFYHWNQLSLHNKSRVNSCIRIKKNKYESIIIIFKNNIFSRIIYGEKYKSKVL